MHIRVEKAHKSEQGNIELLLTTGSLQIESIEQALEAGEEVSLRFAAARFGTDPFLVIGVRKAGRGFDLLLPKTMWGPLIDDVNQIVLVCEESGKRIVSSLDFDDEAFHEFLDQCHLRYEDDPELDVVGQIVTFFG